MAANYSTSSILPKGTEIAASPGNTEQTYRMKKTARAILDELESLGDSEIASHSARFFKTGTGEYGEGDRFFGIRVPVVRRVARKYRGTPMRSVIALL